MIKKATMNESYTVAVLAQCLWPHHSVEDLQEEMGTYISSPTASLFLYFEEDVAVGFAQCQLRQDYVEGTSTSPVGYLEGLFIKEEARRKGYAKALLASCEKWAAEKGCSEFASDCELENEESLKFHVKLGFIEANRIICFNKNLS